MLLRLQYPTYFWPYKTCELYQSVIDNRWIKLAMVPSQGMIRRQYKQGPRKEIQKRLAED
mgnify:CR=1 FL=1